MSSLPSADRRELLEIARSSLTLAASGQPLPDRILSDRSSRSENLGRPTGAFVSLHYRSRLRGCVGQLTAELPLIDVVAYCARAAALSDPRFAPVLPDELLGIEIEISVLSPLETVVPAQIEAGRHGILVTRGRQRGVLLPQVASDFHWTAMRFLEETCEKAGLARDAWKDSGTRIEAFTAEVFSEGSTLAEDKVLSETPMDPPKLNDYSSST